jgi:hypothetical protein
MLEGLGQISQVQFVKYDNWSAHLHLKETMSPEGEKCNGIILAANKIKIEIQVSKWLCRSRIHGPIFWSSELLYPSFIMPVLSLLQLQWPPASLVIVARSYFRFVC